MRAEVIVVARAHERRGHAVRWLAVSLLAAVAFGPGVSLARASIVVNTTTDETTSGEGSCSLREAVAAANAPATPSVECPGASIGGTTITLQAGTYHLSLGTELELSGTQTAIAIHGASGNPALTTINADAGAQARALLVDAGVRASLSNLTVTGGLTATGANGGTGGNGGNCGGIFNKAR